MKKIIILLLGIFLAGCSSNNSEKKLTIEEILKQNNYIIVDVRTVEEYNEGHIKDSINIPYDQINNDIDLDIEKTILVYCRSGNRSNIAYNELKKLGYEVYDLGAYETINLPKED